MRLLAWNLNYRAARRVIPDWVLPAIVDKVPDIVVLTEYVDGRGQQLTNSKKFSPAYEAFHKGLDDKFIKTTLSKQEQRTTGGVHNQVLIATNEPHSDGNLRAPSIHEALPSNFLHVVTSNGIHVVGFRMPHRTSVVAVDRRKIWDWILTSLSPIQREPAIVAGDFNTDFGDPNDDCQDCAEELLKRRWMWADPGQGSRSYKSGRLIDHILHSPQIVPHKPPCLWDPHASREGRRLLPAGVPDHAMLLFDFDLA